jgi:hypothetical protein
VAHPISTSGIASAEIRAPPAGDSRRSSSFAATPDSKLAAVGLWNAESESKPDPVSQPEGSCPSEQEPSPFLSPRHYEAGAILPPDLIFFSGCVRDCESLALTGCA